MIQSDETKFISIVVNAASGIGYELAKQLAQQGQDLFLIDNTPALVEVAQVCQELGVRETHLITDLSEDQGLAKVLDKLLGLKESIHSLFICLDFQHLSPQKSLYHNLNSSLLLLSQMINKKAKRIVIVAQNGHATLLHQCIKIFLKQYCYGLNREINQKDFIAFTFYLDDLLVQKKSAEELATLCLNSLKHASDKRLHSHRLA